MKNGLGDLWQKIGFNNRLEFQIDGSKTKSSNMESIMQ
jgi:hypothetical protein